ncbi:MAG: endonuclease/exonuclease/phosphatase family protein [Nanoarchaeota archaeon]|nr:endonuclease/exonuclease/phosphatase family protein [Nanoarchaeota archaeon]
MKVIAYNILTGLCNKGKNGDYHKNSKREILVKEVIKKENADIVILSEVCFLRKNKSAVLQNYKKIFGYAYWFGATDNYFAEIDWGVGVLSKFPIVKAYDYNTKHSRFVRVLIKIKNKIITIDAVHPDQYHNEHQRAQWFKTVIRDRKDPYIIAGDFNAFSPQDKYDKNDLIAGFETYYKTEEAYKAKSVVEDILQGKAIKTLIKAGLADTFKVKNKNFDYTFHTSLIGNNTDLSRLDYIFCSKDFKIIDAGIIKNKLTEQASDHYPVYAILELK